MFGTQRLIEQYELRLKDAKETAYKASAQARFAVAALEAKHAAHVQSLESQIADLRKLAFPSLLEASLRVAYADTDAALMGEAQRDLTPAELAEVEAIEREREAILTGTY